VVPVPGDELTRAEPQAQASIPSNGVGLALGLDVTDGARRFHYRFERYLWTVGTLVVALTVDGPLEAMPEHFVVDAVQGSRSVPTCFAEQRHTTACSCAFPLGARGSFNCPRYRAS
jgi:hypothetical protein